MSVIEVVLLAPLVIGFIMILVVFGVLVDQRGNVQGAARDAARMGSLQRDDATANAQAQAAAAADLGNSCAGGPVVTQVNPTNKSLPPRFHRRRLVHRRSDLRRSAVRSRLVQPR